MFYKIILSLILLAFSIQSNAGIRERILERKLNNPDRVISDAKATDIQTPITYQFGTDKEESLDLYKTNINNAPTIILVHGGAWMIGDKSSAKVTRNKVKHYLPLGINIISINYKMLPNATPDKQALSIVKAIEFIKSNNTTLNVDANKIVLMGHSAGAHLIDLINAKPYSFNIEPTWLGVISLDSGALDVTKIMAIPHFSFYDTAFGKDNNYHILMSPTLQLTNKAKPIFLVCSSQRLNSCPQSESYKEVADSLNVKSQVYPIDMSHKEINDKLGLEQKYTADVDKFLKDLNFFN